MSDDDDWEAALDRELAAEAAEVEKKNVAQAKKTDEMLKETTSSLSGPQYQAKTHLKFYPNDNIALNDPILERERRENLIKRTEAQLFGDLLDGCDLNGEVFSELEALPIEGRGNQRLAHIVSAPTSVEARLENIPLKNIAECTKFVDCIGPAITNSSAKSAAWLAFLTGLLTHCVPKMDRKDLTTLKNKLDKMSHEQQCGKKIQAQSKRKVNDTTKSQLINHKEEYDLFYGDNDDDEYDKNEDSDGFM